MAGGGKLSTLEQLTPTDNQTNREMVRSEDTFMGILSRAIPIQPRRGGGGTEWTHALSLPFVAGTTQTVGWLWFGCRLSRQIKLRIT